MLSFDRIAVFLNVKWFHITTIISKLTTFLYILNYNCIIYTYAQAAFLKTEVSYTSYVSHGTTALVGLSLLFIEASRSHTANHPTLGRTPLDE